MIAGSNPGPVLRPAGRPAAVRNLFPTQLLGLSMPSALRAGLRPFKIVPGEFGEPSSPVQIPFRTFNKKGSPWLPFFIKWSGRKDLNLRPLQPHCSALPDCATPRHFTLLIIPQESRGILHEMSGWGKSLPQEQNREQQSCSLLQANIYEARRRLYGNECLFSG